MRKGLVVEAKIIEVRWWGHNYSCGFIGTDGEVSWFYFDF